MHFKNNRFSLFAGLILLTATIQAQQLDKVVVVEGAYQPAVEKAEKINAAPVFSDTILVKPILNYTILPSRIDARYEIKPIKPAKLVGSPLDRLYHSRVRLGFGNYTTPLAEFSIQNLRSKEYSVGAYVYHKSSHSKLKLDNGHKVPAGYGINKVNLYGKRFYEQITLEGDLGLQSLKGRYYGYNTTNFTDSLPVMDEKDIRQWYTSLYANAGLYSMKTDSNALRYKVNLHAGYFSDDYANSQNHINTQGQLSFMIESFRLSLNAQHHFFHSVLDTLRGSNRTVFQFRPVLSKKGDQWSIEVGANSYLVSDDQFRVYPEARLGFEVIENVIDAYFGFNGSLELNHFGKIAMENPYIKPGLYVNDTRHTLTGYGGINGRISSKSGFRVDLQIDSKKNDYFFVNDTISLLENQFTVVYDDNDHMRLGGELWYSPYSYLDFYLRAAYHSYNLEKEEKAWHKPGSELNFTAQYNFKEKIYASADLIYTGKRYGRNSSLNFSTIELKPVWDMNLRFEYKYNDVLSGFLNFHNLFAQQYYLWNNYPAQKFNAMLGFSYKF